MIGINVVCVCPGRAAACDVIEFTSASARRVINWFFAVLAQRGLVMAGIVGGKN